MHRDSPVLQRESFYFTVITGETYGRYHHLEQAMAVFICLSFRTFLKNKFSWVYRSGFLKLQWYIKDFLGDWNGKQQTRSLIYISTNNTSYSTVSVMCSIFFPISAYITLGNNWVWLTAVEKPFTEVQCISKKLQIARRALWNISIDIPVPQFTTLKELFTQLEFLMQIGNKREFGREDKRF